MDPTNRTLLAQKEGVLSNLETIKKGFGEFSNGSFDDTKRAKWTHLNYYFNLYKNVFNGTDITPILSRYNDLVEEKKEFWFNLKSKFGNHLLAEGLYENEIETESDSLLNQAQAIYSNHKVPNEDLSISYIDVSNLVGIDIIDPKVGDYIKIVNQGNLFTSAESKLEISSISRNLRSNGDIEISIVRYNAIDKILEKIIAKSENTKEV